jgi:hypothetical protein
MSMARLCDRATLMRWADEAPSWLVSLVVHLAAFILLALLTVPRQPQCGAGPSLVVEMLDTRGASEAEGLSSLDFSLAKEKEGDPSIKPDVSAVEQEVFSATSELRESMAALTNVAAPTVAPASPAADRLKVAARKTSPRPEGGNRRSERESGGRQGRPGLFDSKGVGNRFVYVLDRSASMGGAVNLLLWAKMELSASIDELKANQEFQVIFYNEEPFIFNPRRGPGPDLLVSASRPNKLRVKRFIESIYPFDGTDHQQALFRAIRMKPDVIFLWTDANEPRLGPIELEQIHVEANGIIINTVEVGFGPEPPDNYNFLVLLARQNGGRHVYIDVTRRVAPNAR